MVPLKLSSADNLDVYYSFGKLDIYYKADFREEKGWVFECFAQDTYDFGLDKDIPYQEIFTKGLNHMIDKNKGKIANNVGWFSQKEQVISQFEILINFDYYYKG